MVVGSLKELGDWKLGKIMTYQSDGVWSLDIQLPQRTDFEYKYLLVTNHVALWEEGPNRKLSLSQNLSGSIHLIDFWQQPVPQSPLQMDTRFSDVKDQLLAGICISFNVYVGSLINGPIETMYVVGGIKPLGDWDKSKANEMTFVSGVAGVGWWSKSFVVPENQFPFEYKFMMELQDGRVVWEKGRNHVFHPVTSSDLVAAVFSNTIFLT
eukprot:TRINITY_DN4361_c0_g2_i2.p2 TRINITY_DN4361_c0_g2~~TRINITY_DN4361_c0_g2_i2.p2  ORF type:complete len:210 (-),score=58.93 TRINITY_DN4361_c0_g2_i2:995-1624(-)